MSQKLTFNTWGVYQMLHEKIKNNTHVMGFCLNNAKKVTSKINNLIIRHIFVRFKAKTGNVV